MPVRGPVRVQVWARHVQLGVDRARTGQAPKVIYWLGASRPAAMVAAVARFGYIAACTLRWHPTAGIRLVLFSPLVLIGLVAWAFGYARACQEAAIPATV